MTHRTARLRAPADIGRALEQARLARGLTQADLAAELDVSQSTISQLENGTPTIYMRRVLEIARITGLELAASWDDDASDD